MKKSILVIIILVLSPIFSPLKAQTEFSPEAGLYSTLLNDLKTSLYTKSPIETVTLEGKERRMFVSWVRDHIHTMKAYKYWEKDLASNIDFFMSRQTPKGMYFDVNQSIYAEVNGKGNNNRIEFTFR